MATSSFLASFYFVNGAIIFFLGILILRYWENLGIQF